MFAPGSLVANLDFVESIFGNGGDPFLPENDAALDIHHWTGTSGCIILAPHLTKLTKKYLVCRTWMMPRNDSDEMACAGSRRMSFITTVRPSRLYVVI